MSQGRNQLCLLPASCWFIAWLIFRPRRWRRNFPGKRRLTFNGLHGVISQKELFVTTAVRTSDPTKIYWLEYLISRNFSGYLGINCDIILICILNK
jgi:hypothetical protein